MNDVQKTYSILSRANEVREFRSPKTPKGTVSGYFDNVDDFDATVRRFNGHANLYVTLNPVDPALLARSRNTAKQYAAHTSSDADVLCLRWLLVDFDPKRPAGISSSAEEHNAALQLAVCCREWLAEEFGVHSVYADSGNGAHLLVPIELANVTANVGLLKGVLHGIGAKCDTQQVCVDRATYNPARISKIYGTRAMKGDNTQDRPHRTACLLETPVDLSPVPIDALHRLANLAPKRIAASAPKVPSGGRFDIRGWMSQHGLVIHAETPYQGGTRFQLSVCPFNSDHGPKDAAVFEFADGRLGFSCFHDGCADRDWHALRDHMEAYRTDTISTFINPIHAAARINWSSGVSQVELPPNPLDEASYHGIVGEFIRMIEPQTEAATSALLLQFLAAVGNVMGRNSFFVVEETKHYPNLFCVIVGQSAKARKGTAWSRVNAILKPVAEDWVTSRIQSGLSTGEGMIRAVRDKVEELRPVRDKTKSTEETEFVVVDRGEADKRLMVVEGEFARILKAMQRQGNTLSALLRHAWDTGDLRVMTKTPQQATGAHISIIGHVTIEELRRNLTETDQGNGFANRFLWAYANRSKLLPHGGDMTAIDMTSLRDRLKRAIAFGQEGNRMHFDQEARKAWEAVYSELSRDQAGLLGSITSRGEAQTLRLAMIYALLDCSATIGEAHLAAALSVWEYCEDSVRYIFGGSHGDPISDAIMSAIRSKTDGLSRTDISGLLGHNHKAERITGVLTLLRERGFVVCETIKTNGRPLEIWRLPR